MIPWYGYLRVVRSSPGSVRMFLHELTTEQQRAFLILARQVMAADERLAMQEVERLEALYRETGLPAETAAGPDAVGDMNYLFASPRVRAVVLLELLLVAHADDDLDPRENAVIRDVAERMEVYDDDWTRFSAWAARYAALRREAETYETQRS
ncbi:MAG: hypothetical protein HKN04_04510 [Rhodothermaceae bacterium]|nr:hypothetical protein [Rhodothermaceae bacterium]